MKKVVIHFKKYFKYINISFLIILLLSCENDEAEINDANGVNNSMTLNNAGTVINVINVNDVNGVGNAKCK